MIKRYNNGIIIYRNGGYYYEKDGVVAGAFLNAEVIKKRFPEKTKKIIPGNIKSKPVLESVNAESK